jgi:type I restriction enzyme R subunit
MYEYRPDIRRPRHAGKELPREVRGLNRVRLTDASSPACWTRSSRRMSSPPPRPCASINSFTRDDGTPLNYTLVNIKDWCKNTFEVVNQLRINTDNSHHRYDVSCSSTACPACRSS